MPLKELYRAEMDRREEARQAQCASFEEAKAELKGLYHSIIDDQEFLRSIHAEVELLDDDLRIDPGKIMIVVTAQQDGSIRLEYEVKKADDYQSIHVPEVKTVGDAERVVARLLAEYGRDD
jgi:hypothetical protein